MTTAAQSKGHAASQAEAACPFALSPLAHYYWAGIGAIPLRFCHEDAAMDLFLSGHGSSDQTQNYTLKCDLVTFCAMGDGLDIPTSWRVFDALAANNLNDLAKYIYHRYSAGEVVPQMTLYGTTDFTSGLFQVGSKIAMQSFDRGTMTLRDVCTLFRPGTVYWIACLS
jgi:hypothetical protein